MAEHHLDPIDLVVVNFYPFERVVENPATNLEVAIENIDIGGPALNCARRRQELRSRGSGR